MITSSFLPNLSKITAGGLLLILSMVGEAQATTPTLTSSFSNSYSLTDLGSVQQIPPAYGGLTFQPGDSNTLLISGSADTPDAGIYSLKVTRNSDNHITGFGIPSLFAKAPGLGSGGIDAGLVYSPSADVLFYTSYDDNSVGQIKSGNSGPDRRIDLNSLGIASSTGALNFVPEGFAGAGRLKITSYTENTFYDTTITPDGSGTYNISAPSKSIKLDGGLDGFIYVKAGNPGFSQDSLLMSEYDNTSVAAYTLDANGDPIPGTRQDFIKELGYHSPTSLTGVAGATLDPLTGDFLFSAYFEDSPSGSRIFEVRSLKNPISVLEPNVAVASLAFLGFVLLSRNKRKNPLEKKHSYNRI